MIAAHLAKRATVALDTYIVDCAWSSDSTALAIAGGEGAVLLITRAAANPEVRKLGQHALGTLAIAWQPGSGTIASSGQDGTLMLWNAAAAVPAKLLNSGTTWTEHLAYAPDGKLAAATGKTLDIWSREGERMGPLAPHASTVAAIAWDASGRELAAATNRAMWVHRIEPPPLAARAYEVASACLTAAFSPNGRVLVAGMQDGAVHLWYRASARDAHMRGYGARVALTHWSANSRHLATSAGSQIVIWDFGGKGPEGSTPLELSAHTDRIDCLAYQPGGPWLASGGRDWRVALWWPGKAELPADVQLCASEVSVLRWSPDGRVLAVGERGGQLSFYALVTKSASPAR
jgi:WD40 repeat protein